jgi:hypothetical protein
MDAMHRPRTERRQGYHLGDGKIDHRTVGTGVDEKFASDLATQFVVLPRPAS